MKPGPSYVNQGFVSKLEPVAGLGRAETTSSLAGKKKAMFYSLWVGEEQESAEFLGGKGSKNIGPGRVDEPKVEGW